jgi:DHA1 family multidrug resistance protein-like MFS transporter
LRERKGRTVRAVLFLCVFLYVFTETLLSPFYPQFFSKVFGVEDLAYSGHYVFVCRLTVVACAPLWGLLSRRFEVRRLLLVGQAGAAVFTALLATAETAGQFLALSVALLAFKSSYLLVYSLIVELSGRDGAPAAAGGYGATFHAAIIASTLVGAFMVGMENPLKLFYVVAAADLLQLALCLRVLRPASGERPVRSPSASGAAGGQLGFLLAIGLIIFTFHFANNTIRPYFTQYAERGFSLSLEASGVLFLIPSVMAILALPFVKRLARPGRLPRLYAIGLATLAAGLALQGLAGGLATLLAGRALYDFFLAISQAALELRLFGASGDDRLHLNYGVAVAFQNAGLLAAPLLASSLVGSHGLASPLLAAAALCAANLVLARLTVFREAAPAGTRTPSIQGKES